MVNHQFLHKKSPFFKILVPMATASFPSPDSPKTPSLKVENSNQEQIENMDHVDDLQMTFKRYEELLPTLPRSAKGWMTEYLVNYQGFWFSPKAGLTAVLLIQDHFKARPSDVFLASCPKTGTTWLKALVFTTINRALYDFSTHPLLGINPHDCIPFLETLIDRNHHAFPELEALPSPRLLATHTPYPLLPSSMVASGCKFVYIWRDTKDVLVSSWYYMNRVRHEGVLSLPLEEAFEMFCEGVSHYGPYWDHVLGYWKASLEMQGRILFLKYEELKRDPLAVVTRLAEFLGKPFSAEEERQGVAEEIVKLCSFEKLSNLGVNKTGVQKFNSKLIVDNRYFFRKGEVGDWTNHLTPEMVERLDQITEEKLHDVGFSTSN